MAAKGPERIETARLLLRRPAADDAEAVFSRYSADAEVTRYVGFPRHTAIDDTRAFLRFSDDQWQRWPAGPYVACSRADGALLGSTGLMFETPYRAATGYVFARDAWGMGYAGEALAAMVEVARATGVLRLYAIVHAEHRASARVLERAGFDFEGTLRRYADFPNLAPGVPQDVGCYARIL